jgi:phosphoribosylamine--glycine ligase
VFQAGTKKLSDGVVTDGGRVLAVTGRGHSIEEARNSAYDCASEIGWEGLYFRKDIGVDLMNYKGI